MTKFEDALREAKETDAKVETVLTLLKALQEETSEETARKLDEIIAVIQGSEDKIDEALKPPVEPEP